MRKAARIAVLIAALGGLVVSTAAPAPGAVGPDPAETDISWIVRLKPGDSAAPLVSSIASDPSVEMSHVYRHVLNGFAFRGSAAAAEALARNPNVLAVQRSRVFQLAQVSSTGGSLAAESGSNGFFRVDGIGAFNAGYRGQTSSGARVRVAILDTGIDSDHIDLAPHLRSSEGKSCVASEPSAEDNHGHGTHVAGIAAAANQGEGVVGLASEAALVSVKVANSDGFLTEDWIICGLDHVAALAADGVPTVANLSFGGFVAEPPGCAGSAYHQAVCNLVNAGVPVVAAAGNDGRDASGYRSAAYPETIAVSAFSDLDGDRTNSGCGLIAGYALGWGCDETHAEFTNHGSIIDVTAPGVRIYSTTFDGAWGVKDGTSMATPHVTGIIAVMLGLNPGLTPAQVRNLLLETGECPDGATSTTGSCTGHGQWNVADSTFLRTVPDPDGIAEPLVNALRAAEAALTAVPPPTLSINDAFVGEGTGPAVFTVLRSGSTSQTVTVHYSVNPGSAATTDYGIASPVPPLTFAPGETSKTITVPIVEDTLDEDEESFTIVLFDAGNASISDGTGVGTIQDDDVPAALSVNDVAVAEGQVASFAVTLSPPSGRTVSVSYGTSNGSATAPSDYGATANQLTFNPGETSKTVNVATVDDSLDEEDEFFTVVLSGGNNASIVDGSGVGTIGDNDAVPSLSIGDVEVEESAGSAVFTVSKSGLTARSVTVEYASGDGTARESADYVRVTGQLSFSPEQTTRTVSVPLVDDALDEITETMVVSLSSPVQASIAHAQGTGSIQDDDNVAPTLSFAITDGSGNAIAGVDLGERVEIAGFIDDPGLADTHTVSIAWGDGSPLEEFTVPPSTTGQISSGGFSRAHSYKAAGDYTILVTVTDTDGGSDSGQGSVAVNGSTLPVVDTVGLVDTSQGLWHLRDSQGEVTSFFYGNPGDVPFTGDWDCDGDATPGLFRLSDAFAYLRNSNTQGIADLRFFFGDPLDVPLAGDFNGDGCDTVSLYRPSTQEFFIINRLGDDDRGLGVADSAFVFGNPGDKPVVGDWDGDGIDEVGLYREATGFFYWRDTLATGTADGDMFFGNPGDRFVAGDWGLVDGEDTPGVFRPSDATFYFRHTLTQGVADSTLTWGQSPWLPIAGDYGLG